MFGIRPMAFRRSQIARLRNLFQISSSLSAHQGRGLRVMKDYDLSVSCRSKEYTSGIEVGHKHEGLQLFDT